MLRSIRLRFVAGLVFIGAAILALAAFAAAWVTHRQGLFRAGMIVLAIGLTSQAVTEGARIWLGFYLSRWIGLKQQPIWRKEQRAGFWALTAVHVILAVIYVAVAVALLLYGAKPGL